MSACTLVGLGRDPITLISARQDLRAERLVFFAADQGFRRRGEPYVDYLECARGPRTNVLESNAALGGPQRDMC